MASPRTVTIVALSVALGLFFVFMGTIKLTPGSAGTLSTRWLRMGTAAFLNKIPVARIKILDLEEKRAYKSYIKALPMLKKMGISSILLRKIIGSLELACGIVMTLVPGRPKDVANFILLLIVLVVLFFHQLVGDPLKRYAHALVFGILLTCRLLIARQPEEQFEKRALSSDGDRQSHRNSASEKNKMKVS